MGDTTHGCQTYSVDKKCDPNFLKQTLNMDADRVVICLGVRSDNVLYREIKNSFDTVFLIGDAVVPRRIGDAIREGYEKAVLLEKSGLS